MTWVRCLHERPGPRLVCLPHAGGSASFYRDWPAGLPELELHAVQYPGRADRIAEDPPTDLLAMAREITEEVAALADRPLALFGHSMGAIVAFEVARQLAERHIPVRHLFASGARAAHDPSYAPAGLADADDDAIMHSLTKLSGTHAELLDDPMLRELVLPYVRADFLMFERYGYRPGPLLDCPVTTVNGADDDHVTPARAKRWRELTTGPCTAREFPGEHFYLLPDPPFAVIRDGVADLNPIGRRS